MAATLFLGAGTFRYWQAWTYLGAYVCASALTLRYLAVDDPALLERRLKGGPWNESEPAQKIIMSFASLGFLALLIVPALDRRFDWSNPPSSMCVAADFLFLAGFYIMLRVLRENSFAASTIVVAPDQRLIDTGPYARVRHPMYAGGLLYLAATPIALGSYWGLLAFVAVTPFLIWRLLDEERVLRERLPGYEDYCDRLRWRLIPGVF